MDRQIEQLTVAKLGEMPEPNQGASIATAPSHAKSGTCIERLQQEIARLLFKNQIIRFELLAAQQKIARIDQELFGAGIGDLENSFPLIESGTCAICAGQPSPTCRSFHSHCIIRGKE